MLADINSVTVQNYTLYVSTKNVKITKYDTILTILLSEDYTYTRFLVNRALKSRGV
jgi:hypothetical protein